VQKHASPSQYMTALPEVAFSRNRTAAPTA
jgi:hypothetical protein